MNTSGGTGPFVGCDPAQEGLSQDDPTGHEVDDGLVLEVELVALQGAEQIESHRELAHRLA